MRIYLIVLLIDILEKIYLFFSKIKKLIGNLCFWCIDKMQKRVKL